MPNLMNGVSQQALAMRLPSQAEVQVNGSSSIVEGTNKRQPLKHIAKIVDGQAGAAYTHLINRDTTERYVAMVFDGSIKVFDLDGTERTVTYPDGAGYITGVSPESDIRALTIADNTFIVNKEAVVGKLPELTPATPAQSLLFVRSVNYDVTYTVRVDGQDIIVYTTDDAYGDAADAFSVPAPTDTTEGTDEPIPVDFMPEAPQAIREQAWEAQQLDSATADKPKVSVDEVVDKIGAVLAAELHPDYTVDVYSPVISVKRNDGTPFDIEFTDSSGGIHTRAVPGKIQRFSELPVVAPHGYIVKVFGDDVSDVDDYFLRFEANNGGPGMDAGVWVETVGPGVEYKLDASTMPHSLIRQPDGNFTLEQVEWGEREAGDTETAPWPSFVGAKISDVFLATNRMCFLSGGNVVMSRTNALFSFFPETVATLLDDGPIDVSASGTSVANLKYAVPYRKEIILFSGQTQYSIDAKTLLASEPPEVKHTTSYEIDDGAAPIPVGKTVFFASRRKQHTAVMEYYVIPETETTDASDLTKHVPTYIPAGVFKLTGSASADTMLLLSAGASDKVYVYRYYWRGEQKLQSSWSVWEFSTGCSILSAGMVNDTTYFVTQYQDGVYLESVDMGEGLTEDGSRFVVRLDRRLDQTQVTVAYDAILDRSTITLPYTLATTPEIVFRPQDPQFTEYTFPTFISIGVNSVVVEGDLSSSLFYVGLPYRFTYEFSKPVLKTSVASGGQASVIAGRLQLHKFHLSFAETGYFKVEVEAGNGQTYTYTHTGQILGTPSAVVGSRDVEDGTFSFRVNANAKNARITVINDSFLPSNLTGAEWEGRFERRTSVI
jgi:hypothetical protein